MQTDPTSSLGTRTPVPELGEPFAPISAPRGLGHPASEPRAWRWPRTASANRGLASTVPSRERAARGRRSGSEAVGSAMPWPGAAVGRGSQSPWQTFRPRLPRWDSTTGGRAIAPGSEESPDEPLLGGASCWTSELPPRRIVCPVQPLLTGSRQNQKKRKNTRGNEPTLTAPSPVRAARRGGREPTGGPTAAPRRPPAARRLRPSPCGGERVRPALPSPSHAPTAGFGAAAVPAPFTLLFPKSPAPSPSPEVRIRQKQWPKTSLFCSVTSQIFIFLVKKQHKNPNVSF